MNLEAAILEEHSRKQTDRIAAWVGDSATRFAQLFGLMMNGAPRVQQCAAWSVSRCLQHRPELVAPLIDDVVRIIGDRRRHQAVRRNLFQVLQVADIPEHCRDAVFEAAMEALGRRKDPIAVRAYAVSVLKRYTEWYPDLLPEVKRHVAEAAAGSSAALLSRARNEFGIGLNAEDA